MYFYIRSPKDMKIHFPLNRNFKLMDLYLVEKQSCQGAQLDSSFYPLVLSQKGLCRAGSLPLLTSRRSHLGCSAQDFSLPPSDKGLCFAREREGRVSLLEEIVRSCTVAVCPADGNIC